MKSGSLELLLITLDGALAKLPRSSCTEAAAAVGMRERDGGLSGVAAPAAPEDEAVGGLRGLRDELCD